MAGFEGQATLANNIQSLQRFFRCATKIVDLHRYEK